jgi:hypothetical protein
MEYLISIPYFGAGLLFWPMFRLFHPRRSLRSKRLWRVFITTFVILLGLASVFGIVALLGRFNHNWLWGSLWFPLVNLVSLGCSIVACTDSDETAA